MLRFKQNKLFIFQFDTKDKFFQFKNTKSVLTISINDFNFQNKFIFDSISNQSCLYCNFYNLFFLNCRGKTFLNLLDSYLCSIFLSNSKNNYLNNYIPFITDLIYKKIDLISVKKSNLNLKFEGLTYYYYFLNKHKVFLGE